MNNLFFLIHYIMLSLLLLISGIRLGQALGKKKYGNLVSLQILDETGEQIAFKYMGKDEYIANISKKFLIWNQKIKN